MRPTPESPRIQSATRRTRTAVTAVAALTGLIAAVSTSSAPAAASAGPGPHDRSASSRVGAYTSWSVRGDPDNGIISTDGYDFGPDSGIRAQGNAHSFTLRVPEPQQPGRVQGEGLTLDVAGPGTADLQAGQTYTGAVRWIGSENPAPALSFSAFGTGGCESLSSFTIQELTTTPSGDIASAELTFEFHCYGHPPAVYGSVALNATNPPAVLAPTLRVAQPRGTPSLDYGESFTVQAKLSSTSPIRELAVYLVPRVGREQLLLRGTVDLGGTLSATVHPTETGVVQVRFDGLGQYPDRVDGVAVSVSGKVRSALRGADGRRGRYRLFRASHDAVIVAQLLPEHRKDCITFRAEFRIRGRWGHDGVVRCATLNRDSVASVYVAGDPRLVGIPIRIRAEWKGDKRSGAATGDWEYLRFVR